MPHFVFSGGIVPHTCSSCSTCRDDVSGYAKQPAASASTAVVVTPRMPLRRCVTATAQRGALFFPRAEVDLIGNTIVSGEARRPAAEEQQPFFT